MKFQTVPRFASVFMKKSYRDGQKIFACNSLVKFFLVHFENKNGREKKHLKTTIIDRYIKYIITCRFLQNQYYLQIGHVID